MAQMFRILGKRGRITIPFEIRQRVGFSYNDVLSSTEAPEGRTVIGRPQFINGIFSNFTPCLRSIERILVGGIFAVFCRIRMMQ